MNRIVQKIKVACMALVCVCAMFGMTMKVQAASADNSLAYITLSEGTLSPEFEGSHLNYTVQVSADTSSIEVSAKTVNSAAKILSGTGSYELADGENKIKILVEAENGNQVTYRITVMKGATAAPATEPEDVTGEPAGEPDAPEEATPIANADGYVVSDSVSTADIPTGFSAAQVMYQEQECTGYVFENGDLTLLYMTNEAGDGAFFVYDQATGETYPFVKLSCGDHYIMLLKGSKEEIGLTEAELTIGETVFAGAFQETAGDFYQFYAMNETGATGWYQYDVQEGTYQRYTIEEEVLEGTTDEYLQKAYNELNDTYTARKDKDMKIIAGLIIVLVLLIFVIINLILKSREEDADEEEDIFNEQSEGKKSRKKNKKQDIFDDFDDVADLKEMIEDLQEEEAAEKAAAEAEADKVPEDEKEEPEQEDLLETKPWTDEEEFMDFEEEPEFMSGHKKEKKEKKERRRKNRDIFDDDQEGGLFGSDKLFVEEKDSDDDEIEVMDLNDL